MRVLRCECSRCKLFQKATAGLGDLSYETCVEAKKIFFEERKYQAALIEYAKDRNIMACLPTGSGKTYIALMLIKHFQDVIVSENKKAFFLANTIPLVNQQAAFIARNSDLKVRHLTGDMEVDYWGKEKWEVIITEFQVMAMTAQIFLNMIRHKYIKLTQVALLIFDECHHAVGEHPMAHIMKEYNMDKMMSSSHAMPRILGLSATIIKGTCKPAEVPVKIRELESTMDSAAITYKDYEEVQSHSTSSIIQKISVPASNHYIDDSVVAQLTEFSKSLQVLRNEKKKAKMKAAKLSPQDLDPKLSNFDNLYQMLNKKPTPGDLRVAVDDVIHSYKELGLYCTRISLNLRLAFIEFCIMDINDGEVQGWYLKVKRYFEQLRGQIENYMEYNESSPERYPVTFISAKVKSLLEILKKYRAYETGPQCQFGNDKHLCGLIFTDRRATAQILSWYLTDLSKVSEDFKFLRPHFVVGTSRSAFESVESRVYARKQAETLHLFRTRGLNLLCATSVLEEGIDVPSCNFVVRFDPVQTYTSFIQSMGRARRKEAEFFAMLPQNDFLKCSAKLDEFVLINEQITAYLRANVEKIDADLHEIRNNWGPDPIPPICPGGTVDSPRITMDSAEELVDRYCSLLPCDGISTSQTLCWWNSLGTSFRASVKLPLNGAVKQTVVGDVMTSKELARKAVYMEVAKRLLDAGCFDDQLLPFHPPLPIKVKRFLQDIVPFGFGDLEETDTEMKELEEGKTATEEDKETEVIYRTEWYPKKLPELYNGNLEPDSPLYVYKINLELFNKNETWKKLYDLQDAEDGFAIISSEPIPSLGKFPLFGPFGTLNCFLSPLDSKAERKLPASMLHDIEYLQHQLWTLLLGIEHPLFAKGNAQGLTITPIAKDPKRNYFSISYGLHVMKTYMEDLKSIKTFKPPRNRPAQGHCPNPDPEIVARLQNKYGCRAVIAWYNKTLYLADCVRADKNPTTERNPTENVTLQHFLEKQFPVIRQIQNPFQPLIQTKLAGLAVGRSEKDPIQLNYLFEQPKKEDDGEPIFLVPELLFALNVSSSFLVQVKFLPSIIHRVTRLVLARELLSSVSTTLGWPTILREDEIKTELEFTTDLHTANKVREDERKKRRLQERNEKLHPRKRNIDPSNRQNIEDREFHYEFIHPNEITKEDIKLFHDAVSVHSSARKITWKSTEVEVVESNLSIPSKFELSNIAEIDFESLERPLEDLSSGPPLLYVMQALSTKMSNEGSNSDMLISIGTSFVSFALSLFCYSHFPSFSEPLLCQFRNCLMSMRLLQKFAKNKGLPELLAGSDFHPGVSWMPLGKQLANNHLGELAARYRLHLNIYDEIINRSPKDAAHRIRGMTSREIEDFLKAKVVAGETSAAAGTAGGSTAPVVPASSRKQDRKKKIFSLQHCTFTHLEMADYDVLNGFYSIVGAFFHGCGSNGAYKALEWLELRAPDEEGTGRHLSNLREITNVDGFSPNAALCKDFEKVEEIIQYKFKNKALLIQAFTHPTYPGHDLRDCYQRLEFLGDSILDLLLTYHVYSRPLDGRTFEDLKNIRSALVNGVTYASLAVRYGLHKRLLHMSKPLVDMIDNFVIYQESVEHHVVGHFTLATDEDCRGPNHIEVPKVLADIWEALAGAIFLDGDKSLDTVWRVYYRLMEHELDVFWEDKPQSPMQELQEMMKKEEIDVQYRRHTGKKTAARGRECFRVDLGPLGYYFGMGTNRQRAKEASAKLGLKLLKQENRFIKENITSLKLLNM